MIETELQIAEKFYKRIRFLPNGCWQWVGAMTGYGYGSFTMWVDGEWREFRAHRVSYENHIEPIPEGLVPDHLCRNRSCVNPFHIEPVTNRENLLRGNGACARNARKTHCIYGHPLAGDNLKIDKQGFRVCLICKCRRDGKWRLKHRGKEKDGKD